MRKSEESLDDFTVKAAPKPAEPPRVLWLRPTGEVEVLKPLARGESAAKSDEHAGAKAPQRLSWFHRSLAVGGALAMIALILVSAIVIGVYEPPAETASGPIGSAGDPSDLAADQQVYDKLTPPSKEIIPDVFTMTSSTAVPEELNGVRSIARRRRDRKRVQLAAYRPQRRPRRPHPVLTKFVPTTLVIYAVNGEIKTRIEPQVASTYKKPLTLTN